MLLDDRRGCIDHRAGVDAWRDGGAGVEQRGQFRERDIRIVGDQCGAGITFRIARAHDHDAGIAFGELAAVAGIGEKG